jgi:hypothetical protein
MIETRGEEAATVGEGTVKQPKKCAMAEGYQIP